jgi:hypothetical protein
MCVLATRKYSALPPCTKTALYRPLDKVTEKLVSGVEPLRVRVRPLQPLHPRHRIALRCPQQQVIMVPHRHVRVHASTRFSAVFVQRVEEVALESIGEAYHEHRRALMRDLWLGLTDLYYLFHRRDLTPEIVEAERGDRATIGGPEGFARILRLRDLHRELDQAVLTAYGWQTTSDFGPPLPLGHGFHEVEYLPENDRTWFTIHPDARREVLARLLKLNHQRAGRKAGLRSPVRISNASPFASLS